jgi:octaprenyl-diphosphate synthase
MTGTGVNGSLAAGAGRFEERLCHVLVADWLLDMEVELIGIKASAALARHTWGGGKRLRPITFLLSYLSASAENGRSTMARGREVQLAAALELMHEASLVHDDLVDRSNLRRGKPTVQMSNGAGRALLMGDYMVFRALKMVLDVAESAADIRLAQRLADTGLQIAHGQLEQLERYLYAESPEARMSLDDYKGIIAKKTAMFFAGCAEGGAALVGAKPAVCEPYHRFGLEMGVAFQMLDDLIDVIGDPEVAAKSLTNNLAEGTVTLPFIHGYWLDPEHPGLLQLANAQPLDPDQQAATLEFVRSQPVQQRCRETIAEHARRSLEAWSELPGNAFSLGLHDLLTFICSASWGGMPPQLDGLVDLGPQTTKGRQQ